MTRRLFLAVSVAVVLSLGVVGLGVYPFESVGLLAQEAKKCEKCGHERCPGDCSKCPDCRATQKCAKCGHIGCPGDCNKCKQCQREKSGY